VGEPRVWSIARLADGDCRDAAVDVNGFGLNCTIPIDDEPEPAGATPSACSPPRCRPAP